MSCHAMQCITVGSKIGLYWTRNQDLEGDGMGRLYLNGMECNVMYLRLELT